MSKREDVIAGVFALVRATFPDGESRRNGDKPVAAAPGGNIIVRDGSLTLDDEELSPHTYLYAHRIPIEIGAFQTGSGDPPETILDGMMTLLGNAILADPTLGGLVDLLEPDMPDEQDLGTAGSPVGRWADVAVIAHYASTSPLI